MANWVKYKDQQRVNLDNALAYSLYTDSIEEDGVHLIEFKLLIGNDEIELVWNFGTEQEAQECLKWLDEVSGVREFETKKMKAIKEQRKAIFN